MTNQFIRFKSMDGEVYISKNSISSIKEMKTVGHISIKDDKPFNADYTFIEITLNEINGDGENNVIQVKSDLESFTNQFLKD